jgi:hypothetical protein
MGDSDEHPEEALRTLDTDLSTTIERLQRIRVELALILREAAPTDLPLELGPATTEAGLSDNDRSFIVVLTRLLGPQGLQAYAEILQTYRATPEVSAFDNLPADADEQTRAELARQLFPHVHDLVSDRPGLETVNNDAPGGPRFAAQTVVQAIQDLYNPAQIDVMRRIALLGQAPEKA